MSKDIFEWAEARQKYRDSIVCTNPTIYDVTKNVYWTRRLGDKRKYKVPENVVYCGFVDERYPYLAYLQISSKSTHYAQKTAKAVKTLEEYATANPFDKVANRSAAEEIGIFKNCRFFDIRWLDNSVILPRLVEFKPQEFKEFPTDEIIAAIGTRKSFIFENIIDGFSIRTNERGVGIYSRNSLVRKAIESTKTISDPKEKIEQFLRELIALGYSITKINYAFNMLGENNLFYEIADKIIGHPGNVYLKSSVTSGGISIIRISKTAEGFKFETDSPEVLRLQEAFKMFPHQVCSDREMIAAMLLMLPSPIIEEEIPGELVDGNRAEFRILCQEASENNAFQVIAHYTKMSSNKVAGNISLGGHGERTFDVLCKIYSQHFPEETQDMIRQRARIALERLVKDSKEFATIYYAKSREQGNIPRKDFAVDVTPVWNEKEKDVEFYLLEVQSGYGFKGLSECDPKAAEKVQLCKKILAERSVREWQRHMKDVFPEATFRSGLGTPLDWRMLSRNQTSKKTVAMG